VFTGIVAELGHLRQIAIGEESARLNIAAGHVLADVTLGASIAVNGVCLTVVRFGKDYFEADVMAETLIKTNLGKLSPGDKVNLEPALKLTDRLGGHLVSGHIDGVGLISNQEKKGIALVIKIEAPDKLLRYLVPKGSVAIDGISLTVVECWADSFSVSLIPHTLKATTLGYKTIGNQVNLETDIIAKYVERLLVPHHDQSRNSKLTMDYLAQHGFL
jgi:riboflavin synthase